MVGAVLDVPAGFTNAAPSPLVSNKRDLEILILRGRVSSNGNGLKGVAVTDGLNTTTTDSRGNYELLSNNTAELVYISIPAGYAISHDKGIAKFYQTVAGKNGTSSLLITPIAREG